MHNGELYDYWERKPKLAEKYRFKSSSDSEIVGMLYKDVTKFLTKLVWSKRLLGSIGRNVGSCDIWWQYKAILCWKRLYWHCSHLFWYNLRRYVILVIWNEDYSWLSTECSTIASRYRNIIYSRSFYKQFFADLVMVSSYLA